MRPFSSSRADWKFSATCPKCGIEYVGESLGMVKLAMLSHTGRSSNCAVSTPDEIDDMITTVNNNPAPSILHAIGRPGYYE
jgi:hypothetical protein